MNEMLNVQISLSLAGAADKKWAESIPGQTWTKLLWADPEIGSYATLLRWRKGFVAPPHTHLSDAHFLMLTGRIQVRDGIYGPGDYGYEPKGAVHDTTTTLEDCVYLFICNGVTVMAEDKASGRPSYAVSCADVIASYRKACG